MRGLLRRGLGLGLGLGFRGDMSRDSYQMSTHSLQVVCFASTLKSDCTGLSKIGETLVTPPDLPSPHAFTHRSAHALTRSRLLCSEVKASEPITLSPATTRFLAVVGLSPKYALACFADGATADSVATQCPVGGTCTQEGQRCVVNTNGVVSSDLCCQRGVVCLLSLCLIAPRTLRQRKQRVLRLDLILTLQSCRVILSGGW